MLVKIHDGTDSLAYLIRSYLGGYDGFGENCVIMWFYDITISSDLSLDDCDVMIINSKDVTKNMDRSKLLILDEDIQRPLRQKNLLAVLDNYKIKNNIKSANINNRVHKVDNLIKSFKNEKLGDTKIERQNIKPKKIENKKIENKKINQQYIQAEAELAICNDFNSLSKVANKYGIGNDICAKYKHFIDSGKKGLFMMNIKNRLRTKLC